MILANSNPATIMTDPDFADAHLHRAADRRRAGRDHRAGAARRRAAHPRRPDRASTWPWSCTSAGVIGAPGTPEMIGANAEAIATAEDRERFKAGHGRDRPRRAGRRASPTRSTRPWRSWPSDRPAGHRAPGLHPRRAGHRHRRRPSTSSRRIAATGLDASPISEILIEESIAGLEGVRARGHARPRRQLRDHLLDREPRPDGRPHRRLDHRRPGPDAVRRRVPADARRRVRLHPAGRCGDRRLATCSSPSTRATGDQVVIEMNPRVSPVVGAGLEGHRLPDRQDRRPLAVGYTLDEIPNDITRQDAGQLRADHRLRRHQDPALGVREVARHHRRARHPDAVASARRWPSGARSPRACRRPCARSSRAASGSTATRPRPQLDDARPTTSCWRRPPIATPDRLFQLEAALRRGIARRARSPRPPASTRGSSTRCWPIVEERARAGRPVGLDGMTRARLAAGQAARLLRRPARPTCGASTEAEVRAARAGGRRAAHVQDRRHLRGRVRGRDAVPLLDLRGRGRGRARPTGRRS